MLDLLLGYPTYSWGLTLAGVFPAYRVLLFRMNRPEAIAELAAWTGCWDAILILASVVVCGLAIRTLEGNRRLERATPQHAPHETAGVG